MFRQIHTIAAARPGAHARPRRDGIRPGRMPRRSPVTRRQRGSALALAAALAALATVPGAVEEELTRETSLAALVADRPARYKIKEPPLRPRAARSSRRPADVVQAAVKRRAAKHVAQRPQTFVIRRGDTLSGIARALGLDSSDWRLLYDANPGIHDPHLIQPGVLLRIPVPGERVTRRPVPVREEASAQPEEIPGASVWDRLARCESGGDWHINTGNGYYGGLQFALSSWRAVGGSGYPHQHSRATQIRMARRLLDLQGWRAWPACSRKLGLR